MGWKPVNKKKWENKPKVWNIKIFGNKVIINTFNIFITYERKTLLEGKNVKSSTRSSSTLS
jgi:hypothetical protein